MNANIGNLYRVEVALYVDGEVSEESRLALQQRLANDFQCTAYCAVNPKQETSKLAYTLTGIAVFLGVGMTFHEWGTAAMLAAIVAIAVTSVEIFVKSIIHGAMNGVYRGVTGIRRNGR